MDVDVFSPSLPVTPTTPQITHDHLIPQIRSDEELGELVADSFCGCFVRVGKWVS